MTEPRKFELIEKALTRPSGARFFRCALQVNPFDYVSTYHGEPGGRGEDDYNLALSTACEKQGVEVVGIADHGAVDSVDRIRLALESKGVVVFPGFEIASTEKIHMVCLFEKGTSASDLNRFLGALGLTDCNEKVKPSKYGCLEIAEKILSELNGIWYAAHMLGKNGLLRLDGAGQNFVHIWQEQSLVLAGQIAGAREGIPLAYQSIVSNEDPAYRRNRHIALINAKDIGKPEAVADPGASCRIKMTRPSIEALKQAFLDPESRIILSTDVECKPKSKIIAVAWEGGFLDGMQMHLSDHLNALIGGRGTGKSTVIESIRFAFGKQPSGEEAKRSHNSIIRDVLGTGSRIHVRLSSGRFLGKEYTIRRQFGAASEVFDDGYSLSQHLPEELLPGLQVIGQNEIWEIARDPQSQTALVNRFVPDSAPFDTRIAEIRRRLAENRIRLLKQREDFEDLASHVNRLPRIEEQITSYKNLHLEEKLGAARKLSRESSIVNRFKEEFANIEQGAKQLKESALLDLVYLSPQAIAELPNKEELERAGRVLHDLAHAAISASSSFDEAAGGLRNKMRATIEAWEKKKADIERALQEATSSVPDFAGKRGTEIGNEFAGLLRDLETIRPMEGRRASLENALKETRRERQELLSEWSAAHYERFRSAEQRIEALNSGPPLKGKVRLRIQQCKGRENLKEFLKGLGGVGDKGVSWVDNSEELMVVALVDLIRKGEDALLANYKSAGLRPGVAQQLVGLTEEQICRLEEVEIQDTVIIELNTAHSDASPEFCPLEKLSTGQKCTAILHLLMLQSDDPLIIDQPEDNLDNAFIAERVVSDLRAGKCKRQFLFATHNANIPVFGDAEWIGVLTADNQQATLSDEHVGSIDKPTVQEAVKQVLEGGSTAFETRKLKYGF